MNSLRCTCSLAALENAELRVQLHNRSDAACLIDQRAAEYCHPPYQPDKRRISRNHVEKSMKRDDIYQYFWTYIYIRTNSVFPRYASLGGGIVIFSLSSFRFPPLSSPSSFLEGQREGGGGGVCRRVGVSLCLPKQS